MTMSGSKLLTGVAALCLALSSLPALAQGTVVFSGVGGVAGKAYTDHILPVFEKATGIRVQYVPGTILEGLTKVEAQRNNPSVDIVVITDETYAQYRKKDLFEPLTPALVPRINEIYPAVRYPGDVAVPALIATAGIAYDKEVFASKGFPPPTSVKDLWRPEYKGKVVIWTPSTTTGVLMLLMVNAVEGGTINNVDPGFKKIREMKDDVFFNNADEMSMLMQQKRVWIGWWNNPRAEQVKASGVPIEFVIPKEGAPLFTNGMALVKGAPNRANALKLMNWLLSDEGQQLIAKHYRGGPVFPSVKLTPDVAAQVPYGKVVENGAFLVDMDTVVRNRAAWLERWGKEIAR
jgi:putative spermidine/putrescine transport system substrate-binding protein